VVPALYGVTFDTIGNAFCHGTGATLTEISGIDTVNPLVTSFARSAKAPPDSRSPPASRSPADHSCRTIQRKPVRWLVNADFTGDGTIFAVTSVPEPTPALLLVAAGALLLLGRRAFRSRQTNAAVTSTALVAAVSALRRGSSICRTLLCVAGHRQRARHVAVFGVQ